MTSSPNHASRIRTSLFVSALALLVAVQTATAQTDVWTAKGPDGAIVNAVAIDPQVAGTMYIGTETNGIFKSIDGGTTWSAANEGLPGIRIFSVVVDAQLSTTLYASVDGNGVFKSVDGGANWTDANTGIPLSIRGAIFCLAIDPQNPATLYAGTNDGGVYKTVDGGATWTRAPGVTPLTVASLAIDPQNPNVVYAGTDLNLWKSTDGGGTWSQAGIDRASVFGLTIDPIVSTTIYARLRVFSTQPGLSGTYKSTDGGANWTLILSNGGLPAVDPAMPNTLYAPLANGAVKSTDGGGTWSAMSEGLADFSVLTLAIDSATRMLYAGTNGGGVFAHSIELPRFALSVTKAGMGNGTVTSSPDGITCGPNCSASFVSATRVTLTATSASASIFLGWKGCDSSSGATCVVTMHTARTVSARFFGVPLPFVGARPVTTSLRIR